MGSGMDHELHAYDATHGERRVERKSRRKPSAFNTERCSEAKKVDQTATQESKEAQGKEKAVTIGSVAAAAMVSERVFELDALEVYKDSDHRSSWWKVREVWTGQNTCSPPSDLRTHRM